MNQYRIKRKSFSDAQTEKQTKDPAVLSEVCVQEVCVCVWPCVCVCVCACVSKGPALLLVESVCYDSPRVHTVTRPEVPPSMSQGMTVFAHGFMGIKTSENNTVHAASTWGCSWSETKDPPKPQSRNPARKPEAERRPWFQSKLDRRTSVWGMPIKQQRSSFRQQPDR